MDSQDAPGLPCGTSCPQAGDEPRAPGVSQPVRGRLIGEQQLGAVALRLHRAPRLVPADLLPARASLGFCRGRWGKENASPFARADLVAGSLGTGPWPVLVDLRVWPEEPLHCPHPGGSCPHVGFLGLEKYRQTAKEASQ